MTNFLKEKQKSETEKEKRKVKEEKGKAKEKSKNDTSDQEHAGPSTRSKHHKPAATDEDDGADVHIHDLTNDDGLYRKKSRLF